MVGSYYHTGVDNLPFYTDEDWYFDFYGLLPKVLEEMSVSYLWAGSGVWSVPDVTGLVYDIRISSSLTRLK